MIAIAGCACTPCVVCTGEPFKWQINFYINLTLISQETTQSLLEVLHSQTHVHTQIALA